MINWADVIQSTRTNPEAAPWELVGQPPAGQQVAIVSNGRSYRVIGPTGQTLNDLPNLTAAMSAVSSAQSAIFRDYKPDAGGNYTVAKTYGGAGTDVPTNPSTFSSSPAIPQNMPTQIATTSPPIPAAASAPASIPFKQGLTSTQQGSINTLIATGRQFNETDARNYAYATGAADYKQFIGKTGNDILGIKPTPSSSTPDFTASLPGTGGGGTTIDASALGAGTPQPDAYTSELTRLREQTSTALTNLKLPSAPNLAESFNSFQTKLNITDLETELNSITAEQRNLQDSYKMGVDKLRGETLPMDVISGNEKELQTQYNQRQSLLDSRRATVADMLRTRQSLVSTMMDLTQRDYANSVQAYEAQYSLIKDLQTTIEKKQNTYSSADNQVRDDARANLTLLQNTIKSSGKSWDEITPDMKLQINKLELQAGLPQGTTETFSRSMPKADLLTTVQGTDPKTNEKTVSFIYADQNGNPGVAVVKKTGTYEKPTASSASGGGGTSSTILSKLNASKGSDGYVNTQVYADLKDIERKRGSKYVTAFEKSYPPEEFLNPQDQTAKKFFQTSSNAITPAKNSTRAPLF